MNVQQPDHFKRGVGSVVLAEPGNQDQYAIRIINKLRLSILANSLPTLKPVEFSLTANAQEQDWAVKSIYANELTSS